MSVVAFPPCAPMAEILSRLNSDLAEAEKYEEAYNGLLAEVDALVVKNALADEEAQRLSKFNAEILGHNNPSQRIMYVDRIRRELHETKHVSPTLRNPVLPSSDCISCRDCCCRRATGMRR